MDDPKQSPFALNKGRVLILVLGAIIVLIAISTYRGGIDAYQALRDANAEATSAGQVQSAPVQ
ncbi:MAG TPA: hypothetical protein VGB81_13530 [Devosia sp.]|jgi:hypothetical protein